MSGREGSGLEERLLGRRATRIAFALLSCLAACGTEVGRVPFRGEGSAESTVPMREGGVAFWADLDLEYDGPAALAYRIELVQEGAVVARAACDPLGPMRVRMHWTEVNWGGHHSRRGLGKMSCAARLPQGGATTVKARLAFSGSPARFALRRADLVVRQ